jgi:hypothetical protein
MNQQQDPPPEQGLASNASNNTADASGVAAAAVAQRILLLDRPVYVRTPPEYLDPKHCGLVLCGNNAGRGVVWLRQDGYDSLLLEDPGAYEKQAATAEEPFALPQGRLFGNNLDSVLQEQRDRGATVAITPTRYIHAGDADALKGLMRTAQIIERSDVIVSVPIDLAWLRTESLGQLIAVLQRIPHQKPSSWAVSTTRWPNSSQPRPTSDSSSPTCQLWGCGVPILPPLTVWLTAVCSPP